MTKPKSGRFPWIKYWPSDWYGDKALRACSLAARGAWADMLCIIHDEHAGGYLLLNGKVPAQAAIAKMLGVPEREYAPLERELEEFGVFSRRASDGAIYSRRIVRESGARRVSEGPLETPPPDLSSELDGAPPSRACARASVLPLASSSSLDGGAGGSEDSRYREPPERPSVIDTHLAMHPSLDTREIRTALEALDEHRVHRRKGRHSSQSIERLLHVWEANCAERGGSARFLAAINAALESGDCTPYDKADRTNGSAADTPTPRHLVPKSSGLLEMPRTKRGGS